MTTHRMGKISAIKLLRSIKLTGLPTLTLQEAKQAVDELERDGDVFESPTVEPGHICRQVEPFIHQDALERYVDAAIAHRRAVKACEVAEKRENETFNKQHEAKRDILAR